MNKQASEELKRKLEEDGNSILSKIAKESKDLKDNMENQGKQLIDTINNENEARKKEADEIKVTENLTIATFFFTFHDYKQNKMEREKEELKSYIENDSKSLKEKLEKEKEELQRRMEEENKKLQIKLR